MRCCNYFTFCLLPRTLNLAVKAIAMNVLFLVYDNN